MAGEKGKVGSAHYELGVDLDPLRKGMKAGNAEVLKAGAATEKAFGQQGKAAADKLANSQGLLVRQSAELKKGVLAGVGIAGGLVAFNALKGAVTGVADALGDAVQAAAEDEASIKRLTTSIRENDAAWDGNIDRIEAVIRQRMALAFSDEEQRDGLAILTSVTKDHNEALRLQRIAMDLARLRGMSLASAGELIGKVYAGNLGILSRYGIVLAKGTTATEALAEIQRRAAGQAAAFAEGNAGKLQRAQLEVGEAIEALGYAMAPIVADFAEFSAEAIPQIVGAIGSLGDAFNNLNRFLNADVRLHQDMVEVAGQVAEKLGIEKAVLEQAIEARKQQTEAVEADAQKRREAIGVHHDEIDRIEASIEVMREQGKTSRERVEAIRAATGASEDEYRAAFQQAKTLRERIELLILQREGVVRLTAVVGANTEAEREAQRVASDYLSGQIALSGPVNQLTRDLEERRAALLAERDALLESATASRRSATALAVHKAMSEDARKEAERLAQVTRDVAAKSFRDLRDDAKEAGKAIREAFRGDPDRTIKQLRQEEERLTRQRQRAMREGRWAAAALIDERLREVQTSIRARETQRKQFEEETREQRTRRRQIAAIKEETGLAHGEARKLWQEWGKDWQLKLMVDRGELSAAVAQAIRLRNLLGKDITTTAGSGNAPWPGGWDNDPKTPWPRAAGGWIEPNSAYHINETGRPEMFLTGPGVRGYMLDATKADRLIQSSKSVTNHTVHVHVNAGQFWRPIEAQAWAQAAAPALGQELARIGY